MNKGKDTDNVLRVLVSREYFPRNCYRKNLQILKTLVCRGNYEFRKVWTHMSKHHISFESNAVFLDNYRNFYGGYGLQNAAPVHKFSIARDQMPRKIVDAVLSRSRPAETHTQGQWTGKAGNKMYALTSSTFLVVDLQSGHVGFEVLLLRSDVVKFKNVSWIRAEESLVLSTTMFPRPLNGRHLPGNGPGNLVKILAVFNVLPVTFVCMFEVTRHVFGADVTDAVISQGFLVVMHQSHLVRLYDFDQLVKIHKVEPQVLGDQRYGEAGPLGINMKVTELPCCLFEARCEEWNVQMGGHPWHYLTSPVGFRGCFNVYDLAGGEMAQNGRIVSHKESIEFDRAVFHSDDSSRLIHIRPDDVRVFWLNEKDSGGSALTPAFTITVQYSPLQTAVQDLPFVTSSGRLVKKRYSEDEISGVSMCTTIHEVDYEDELDVLMVCSTVHQPNALQGTVGLYDNSTGHLLKSFTLEEPWADYVEHHVCLDKDTIIQVVKSPSNKFLCQVYRLFERCHDNTPRQRTSRPGLNSKVKRSRDSNTPDNVRPSGRPRRQGTRAVTYEDDDDEI